MLDQKLLHELIKRGIALDLAKAMEVSDEARVICSSHHPFTILFANKAWTAFSCIEQHEVLGKSIVNACFSIDSRGTKELLTFARTAGFASIDIAATDTKLNVSTNISITIRPVVEDSFGHPIVSFYLFTVSKIPTELNLSHEKDHSICSNSSLTESNQTTELNDQSSSPPSYSNSQKDHMIFDESSCPLSADSSSNHSPTLTEKTLRLHDKATKQLKTCII